MQKHEVIIFSHPISFHKIMKVMCHSSCAIGLPQDLQKQQTNINFVHNFGKPKPSAHIHASISGMISECCGLHYQMCVHIITEKTNFRHWLLYALNRMNKKDTVQNISSPTLIKFKFHFWTL